MSYSNINTTINTDLSIRDIVNDMIYGKYGEFGRNTWIVIQKIIRDKNGIPIRHPLAYKLTGEGTNINRPANMTITGYYCTERLTKGMLLPPTRKLVLGDRVQPEQVSKEQDQLILSHNEEIEEDDIVAILKVDESGNIMQPVQAERFSMVTRVYKRALDQGRVEYLFVSLERQK